MLIKLHGIFAEDFGPEYWIEANTAAEAIEGLTRQLGFYDDRPINLRPVARVVGFDSPVDFYEKTEQKEIHLVPAMIGGSGVAKILVGAAVIALAFALPAVGVPLAAWATSAMITVGATLVLNG